MPSKIKIFVPDATYPFSMEDERSEALSNSFRNGLESEFSAEFYEANIGPGYDIPAFGTVLEVSAAIGLFLHGAAIIQGWDTWLAAYKKVHSYFHRKPTLDRSAAAILAVEHLVHSLGKPPGKMTLRGYSTEARFIAEGDSVEIPLEIHEEMPDLNLGTLAHVFNISADSERYLVKVSGTNVQIEKVT